MVLALGHERTDSPAGGQGDGDALVRRDMDGGEEVKPCGCPRTCWHDPVAGPAMHPAVAEAIDKDEDE